MDRTDRLAFEEWSNELCKKRHIATKEYRLKKVGKSKIKKWFYLGKNFDNYSDTLYDKLRRKSFYRWVRKVEIKGFKLHPSWHDYPVECRLYRWHNWKIHYRKFSPHWWDEVKDKALEKFTYNGRTCLYDYDDIITDLLVKLTIKGMCFALLGNAAIHKEQMHEIWLCRKNLLKAHLYEEWFDNEVSLKAVKEKYGIEFDRISYDIKNYIETGEISSPKSFSYSLDPRIVAASEYIPLSDSTKEDREAIIKKCDEIDEFYVNTQRNDNGEFFVAQAQDEALADALSEVGKYLRGWWD